MFIKEGNKKKITCQRSKISNSQKIILRYFSELTVYTQSIDLVLKHVLECLNIFYQTLKLLGISDWIEMKSAFRCLLEAIRHTW